MVVVLGVGACLTFAAATHRYFIVANRWWETLALLFVAVSSQYLPRLILSAVCIASGKRSDTRRQRTGNIRLRIEVDDKSKVEERTFILPVLKDVPRDKRLERLGLTTRMKGDKLEITDIGIDSAAERIRLDVADKNRIVGIETRIPQPDKEWYTLPARMLLALVVVTQRRRKSAAAV